MKLRILENPVATGYTVETYFIPGVPEDCVDKIIEFAERAYGIEDYDYIETDDGLGRLELVCDDFEFEMIVLWAARKDYTTLNPRIISRENGLCETALSKRFRKFLKEDDVEIEVKHEGILEVPEGKNVDDLPISHFEKLAKKKGLGKITKALNNLQVWNKNDDPKLSKWAGDMIDKLNKKMEKKESLLRLNEKDNFNGSIIAAADYYYPRWKSEVMDSSQIRDELVRRFGHSEEFADEVLELIFDKYDDDQRYWDEYDESLIHKKLKKDEAVSRKRTSTRFRNDSSNSVGRFLDKQIKDGKIDKKQVTVVYDKNNNIMWLGKAGFYPLFMSNIEYRSSGYDADHPNELWINARSYTTPFEESFNTARLRNRKNLEVK